MAKKASLILLAGLALVPAAHAGVYSDALGKCLVERSTDADKAQLIEWIFSAIALNPQISQYARISPAQRRQIDRNMAALFNRMLLEDCRPETEAAFKYEGSSALSGAFDLLGRVAGQQIFNSPEVSTGTENFVNLVDLPRLESLMSPASGSPRK